MSERPVRIQRRRTKGWRLPENTVCVDRSTPFGSPFPISRTRSQGKPDKWIVGTWNGPVMWICDDAAEAQTTSVEAYRAWLKLPRQAPLVARIQADLRGKNLACWCGLDQPCHGDTVLEIANTPPPSPPLSPR